MYYRPKVYTASKISHAGLWKSLVYQTKRERSGKENRFTWSHVEFTARWPYMAHLEASSVERPTPSQFSHCWTMDLQDVARSDFVLLYAGELERKPSDWPYGTDSDTLRGALVESGAALALGKRVVSVGLGDAHTWSHHPLSTRLSTLEQARIFFLQYSFKE